MNFITETNIEQEEEYDDIAEIVAMGNTKKFLKLCGEVGYEKVLITRVKAKVGLQKGVEKRLTTWAFDYDTCDGFIFAGPPREGEDGFPAIWSLMEKTGVGRGLGNNQQFNIKLANLAPGHYILKKDKWRKK
jgi:hypothetical protein